MQLPNRQRRRSDAQRAASRANGARSRGPVSQTGKVAACRNALKHGFYVAQDAHVVPEEDPAYPRLLERLRQRFIPGDVLIDALVARLARVMWRMEQAELREAQLLSASVASGVAPNLPVRPFNSLIRQQRMLMQRFFLLLEQLQSLTEKNCRNEPKAAKKPFFSLVYDASCVEGAAHPAPIYCEKRLWRRGWAAFRARAGPLPAPG